MCFRRCIKDSPDFIVEAVTPMVKMKGVAVPFQTYFLKDNRDAARRPSILAVEDLNQSTFFQECEIAPIPQLDRCTSPVTGSYDQDMTGDDGFEDQTALDLPQPIMDPSTGPSHVEQMQVVGAVIGDRKPSGSTSDSADNINSPVGEERVLRCPFEGMARHLRKQPSVEDRRRKVGAIQPLPQPLSAEDAAATAAQDPWTALRPSQSQGRRISESLDLAEAILERKGPRAIPFRLRRRSSALRHFISYSQDNLSPRKKHSTEKHQLKLVDRPTSARTKLQRSPALPEKTPFVLLRPVSPSLSLPCLVDYDDDEFLLYIDSDPADLDTPMSSGFHSDVEHADDRSLGGSSPSPFGDTHNGADSLPMLASASQTKSSASSAGGRDGAATASPAPMRLSLTRSSLPAVSKKLSVAEDSSIPVPLALSRSSTSSTSDKNDSTDRNAAVTTLPTVEPSQRTVSVDSDPHASAKDMPSGDSPPVSVPQGVPSPPVDAKPSADSSLPELPPLAQDRPAPACPEQNSSDSASPASLSMEDSSPRSAGEADCLPTSPPLATDTPSTHPECGSVGTADGPSIQASLPKTQSSRPVCKEHKGADSSSSEPVPQNSPPALHVNSNGSATDSSPSQTTHSGPAGKSRQGDATNDVSTSKSVDPDGPVSPPNVKRLSAIETSL